MTSRFSLLIIFISFILNSFVHANTYRVGGKIFKLEESVTFIEEHSGQTIIATKNPQLDPQPFEFPQRFADKAPIKIYVIDSSYGEFCRTISEIDENINRDKLTFEIFCSKLLFDPLSFSTDLGTGYTIGPIEVDKNQSFKLNFIAENFDCFRKAKVFIDGVVQSDKVLFTACYKYRFGSHDLKFSQPGSYTVRVEVSDYQPGARYRPNVSAGEITIIVKDTGGQSTEYSYGGEVHNLKGKLTLLEKNSNETLEIIGDSQNNPQSFTFAEKVSAGDSINVIVKSSDYNEYCHLERIVDFIPDKDIDDIKVNCRPLNYWPITIKDETNQAITKKTVDVNESFSLTFSPAGVPQCYFHMKTLIDKKQKVEKDFLTCQTATISRSFMFDKVGTYVIRGEFSNFKSGNTTSAPYPAAGEVIVTVQAKNKPFFMIDSFE